MTSPAEAPARILAPAVRGVHSTEHSVIPPEEAEHDHGSTHEGLAEMLVRSPHDVHLKPRASRIAHRADPSPVYDVAEDIECSSLCRVSRHLSHITMDLKCSGVHDHSGEVLGMAMDTYQGSHVEGTAILTRASVDVHCRVEGMTGTHSHANPSLALRPVDDESSPSHPMGMIEKTAQHLQRIDAFGSKPPAVND